VHEILPTEPTTLTAGDSWRWDRYDSDHPPSDGWTLAYHLVGAAKHDITGALVTGAGDHFEVRVPAATTATIAAGRYVLAAYASKDGNRFEVYRDVLVVQPDMATLTDARSHAEKALEAIEAAIEGRLTKDLAGFSVNGRAVQHIDMAALKRLHGIYSHKVWQERNPGRLGPRVEVRFARHT
jgi:hypothetical protein